MSTEQLTDADLIRWVSIVRAQHRLPYYLREADARFGGEPLSDVLLAQVAKFLDERLEKDRDQSKGELERVYVIVRPSGLRYEVELEAESERAARIGRTRFPN